MPSCKSRVVKDYVTLMMYAPCSFETSANIFRPHIPEDLSRGTKNFPKIWTHLKFVSGKMMTRRKFYFENPKISRASAHTKKNCCPGQCDVRNLCTLHLNLMLMCCVSDCNDDCIRASAPTVFPPFSPCSYSVVTVFP